MVHPAEAGDVKGFPSDRQRSAGLQSGKRIIVRGLSHVFPLPTDTGRTVGDQKLGRLQPERKSMGVVTGDHGVRPSFIRGSLSSPIINPDLEFRLIRPRLPKALATKLL